MKKITVILTFLLAVNAFSQEAPSEYIKKANEYLENKDYDEALEMFQYVIDKYPDDKTYNYTLLDIGYIHFIQEDYDEAILLFDKILNLESDKDVKLNSNSYLKHNACAMMSDIYYEKEMYDSSLYYLSLSDTTYPYKGMCGNGNEEIAMDRALRYSDIYMKLNNKSKAIEALLPYIFADLANNDNIIAELKQLLDGEENLLEMFDKSIADMYPEFFDRDGEKFRMYYINFLDAEIGVPNSYEDETRTFDKSRGILDMKSSSFYSMISKLDKQ